MHSSMVHVRTNQRVPFIIYGLLPNKNQNTYKKFFIKISGRVAAIGNPPRSMLFDFEVATINIFSETFPNTPFIICQQIYGKNQELGLQKRNNNDPEFTVLAFILPGKRINNHIERWQRSHYVSYHPVFWKLIQLLRQERSVNRVGLL